MANLGISIDLNDSIFRTGDFIRSLNGELLSYSHQIDANGGYTKASFTLTGALIDLEDWYENGLGWDILTYDEAGIKIFNGFVNKLSFVIGGRSITRGPLMDVANHIAISYSPLNTSVSPPSAGATRLSVYIDDIPSQTKYGRLDEIFSAGQLTVANVISIRNAFLAERKDPETSETVSSEGGTPLITVECLGYVEYLDHYFYSSIATGEINISDKIKAVLAVDPNTLFTADYSRIIANTTQTPSAENIARGREVIMGEVAKGDAAGSRHIFGVYKNRRVEYGPVPTTFDYQYSVTEGKVELFGGGEIMPWDILPGKWLFYTNFMAGKTIPAAVRGDPRALFIESVTFTAPFSFSITGGKVNTSSQILARLGIGGTA